MILSKKSLPVSSLALALTLMSVSACSVKQNMDEMHDDTHAVRKTSEEMKAGMDKTVETSDHMSSQMDKTVSTSDHMSNQMDKTVATSEHMSDQMDHTVATSDHMSSQMDKTVVVATDTEAAVKSTGHTAVETFEKLRQSGAAGLRESALKRMNELDAIESKIMEAGMYMKAFEFQLWDNTDPQAARYLDSFYQQAAQEFVRVLPNYLSDDPSYRPINPSSTKNKDLNLFAIAVSLQELNNNIVMASEKAGFVPQSMAELIKDTLSAAKAKEAHPETVSDFEHEVLINRDNLVYLFQVRMNFLAAMTLAKVSHIQDKGFLGIPGFFRKIKMVTSKWEPTLKDLSVEQIKEYTRYLYGSNDARAFLKSIGVEPTMDSKLTKIYKDMNVSDALHHEVSHPANDEQLADNNRQEALKGFLDQLEIFEGKKAFVKIPALDHPELHKHDSK